MSRKVIGIGIIIVFAAALVFGTVGSVMEVVAVASVPPGAGEGEYVARLAPGPDENPAVATFKYVCPFH